MLLTLQGSFEQTKEVRSCSEGGGEYRWVQESGDLNAEWAEEAEVGETAETELEANQNSARSKKRAQETHSYMIYTPANGSPVKLWIENGELKSSRALTDEEKSKFGGIKTEQEPLGKVRSCFMP